MKKTNNEMIELFNKTANEYYLKHTKKRFEELNKNGYLSYEANSWADGLTGDEWEDEQDCIMCAEEAASQAIENE